MAIREIYLHPERPTMTYLIEQVRARCAGAELPLPDRRTIKARVDRIDRRVAALKRKDSRGVKATKAVPGQYVASRPLEVVQIDHTEVDLFLVDETTREAMSVRPWLTLAIDVFTRMVVGFHLSMDKPSRVSIGLCMLNAVYDKSAWLQENAIDAPWPVAGLPEALHADNGADFRSRAISWACREEGIKLIWRPVGAPHYGGHIERLIGTIMGRVHFYPGTTFANPTARQDNDSARFSTMTFREFECALGWEIAGRYNQEIHSELLMIDSSFALASGGAAFFGHREQRGVGMVGGVVGGGHSSAGGRNGMFRHGFPFRFWRWETSGARASTPFEAAITARN